MARERTTSPSPSSAARRPLQRAQISFGLMWTGESAFMVALAVVAFRDGGVAAVGVITSVRMATAALLTPFLATTADRIRREVVLISIGIARAVALAGTAFLTATDGPLVATYGCAAVAPVARARDRPAPPAPPPPPAPAPPPPAGPPEGPYGCATVATVALSLYRPAHSALLPALAKSPRDLTSANAVRGMLDSLSALLGPVAASAILATSGAPAVFATSAAMSLLAGVAVVALPYDDPPRAGSAPTSVARSLVQGFTTIAGNRDLALVTTLGLVQTFTRGALTVLTVVIAFELLETGEPGVGVLSAAVGAGGVLGSLFALALVGRGGLASWFGVGVALFGAPLALLGIVPEEVAALALLALVGVGNSLIDVAGFTILARRTDEAVLARTFAGFEAILTLGVAIGGLCAPLAVDAFGPRGALVAVGLLAPVAVLLRRPALRRLDGELRVRDADIEVLRQVPMLAALPATTVEQLAADLERADYAPGEVVFEQGDGDDGYYVVVSGRAEVVRDGRQVNALPRGAGFGDVALLGDVPRTATVRASGDASLSLAVLRRTAFLTAVTGYPASAAAAAQAVAEVRARDTSTPPGDEVT